MKKSTVANSSSYRNVSANNTDNVKLNKLAALGDFDDKGVLLDCCDGNIEQAFAMLINEQRHKTQEAQA